ncbi:uncharacterized protein LOC119109893 [Pollicipes pollicipes]|uniref:uncharacterized protein LOC119109893 n=1 Tax=Pollicipes pollicipes TaxID=41117 RepID=UPI001884BEAE|nr:uncharacterized protein LOC119109893 [Pollicipes pollicipes]
MAAEARNNLVAASQNIEGAHRYLSNVEFPYCNPDEVDTLNKVRRHRYFSGIEFPYCNPDEVDILSKATSYVFTDMQSEERHSHAGQCYEITHKRAAALLQWFDQVLTTTIMEDLAQVNKRVKETSLALRQERIRLIKLKGERPRRSGVPMWTSTIDAGVSADDEDLNAMMMQGVSDSEVAKTEETANGPRAKTPPPLTAEEMAPMPSNEAIFGLSYEQFKEDLDNMREQHETEVDHFMRGQERQADKIRGDLEAKLNARRRNRAMRNLEERQKRELAAGAAVS